MAALLQSDLCLGELHLRSCHLSTRGVATLLEAYCVRQRRVFAEHTNFVSAVLDASYPTLCIPRYLCSEIIDCVADFTLDDRLRCHIGLSRACTDNAECTASDTTRRALPAQNSRARRKRVAVEFERSTPLKASQRRVS